jgi:hypothetical protein
MLWVVLLAPSALHADDRPVRYDTSAYCRNTTMTPDGASPDSEQRCLMEQGDAYDHLRRIWSTVPEFMQRDCEMRTRGRGDGDYLALYVCVRNSMRQTPPEASQSGQ